MASASSPYYYNVISHTVRPTLIVHQTHHRQIPPGSIEIALHFQVAYYFTPTAAPFFSQQLIVVTLDILQDRGRLHRVLAPALSGLRIDPSDYQGVIEEIMYVGLGVARARPFQRLFLQSDIFVEGSEISLETLMTRALSILASEFESNNYGMVAATESSIKGMLETVEVGEGGQQDCVVCLEELRVGLRASRMPCSHIFHGDCIVTWLKQSHYCPVCRYEMPTV